MPNPLSGRKSSKKKLDYEEVSGVMDCQTCYEKVREGRIYQATGDLVWICSKGHYSKIENFR